MTKHLLLSGALLCALTMSAENKLYTMDELGIVGGVSANGKYAAVFDDENNLGYLWSIENPEEFTQVKGFQSSKVMLYGVTNDGAAVGAYYLSGRYYPCIYKDGELEALELSDKALNTNEARCVNAEGTIIGGYQMYHDPTSEQGGRYRPCIWKLNPETGEYDLTIYSDIQLPTHQGFITNCMSEDGSIIAGMLFCGAGSIIPAMVKDGELVYWADLEDRWEPWYYKGQVMGYDWNYYIDGYRDGSMRTEPNFLSGEFVAMDAWGNLYGCRDKVTNVNEDGTEATITSYACKYNVYNDEWTEVETGNGIREFLVGLGDSYTFPNGNKVIVADGDMEREATITSEFGVSSPSGITGIFRTSADGKVLGGARQVMNPASGEYQYFPIVIVLDEPLVELPDDGVEVITDTPELTVVLSAGRIDIAGAEGVVYDLDGRMIGSGSTFHVAPGAYVVKSGEASCKVLVK